MCIRDRSDHFARQKVTMEQDELEDDFDVLEPLATRVLNLSLIHIYISIIQKRSTFENVSVLEVYEKAIEVFRDYYQYEVIQGADRKKMEKIPEAAFREAIANALIHRVWDVDSQIRVSMFDDRIEIVSPGGLPSGITEEEYLSGKLSVLRNRNLANVFYRLGFVEIFGMGITRIKQLYAEALIKPDFEVSENAIKIVLPIFEKNADLTKDEIIRCV